MQKVVLEVDSYGCLDVWTYRGPHLVDVTTIYYLRNTRICPFTRQMKQ